jgi:hypothetical protein
MATIAEQFQQMQADLTREKAAMNRTWAKREKQIETIVSSTAKFTGELQRSMERLCRNSRSLPYPPENGPLTTGLRDYGTTDL